MNWFLGTNVMSTPRREPEDARAGSLWNSVRLLALGEALVLLVGAAASAPCAASGAVGAASEAATERSRAGRRADRRAARSVRPGAGAELELHPSQSIPEHEPPNGFTVALAGPASPTRSVFLPARGSRRPSQGGRSRPRGGAPGSLPMRFSSTTRHLQVSKSFVPPRAVEGVGRKTETNPFDALDAWPPRRPESALRARALRAPPSGA